MYQYYWVQAEINGEWQTLYSSANQEQAIAEYEKRTKLCRSRGKLRFKQNREVICVW